VKIFIIKIKVFLDRSEFQGLEWHTVARGLDGGLPTTPKTVPTHRNSFVLFINNFGVNFIPVLFSSAMMEAFNWVNEELAGRYRLSNSSVKQ
jgi:hypothetical protein